MNKKNKQIVVVGGLVELDGDEMANIMLRAVRKHLIEPFIKINLKTFDLSLQNRNSTNDKVTDQAIQAIKQLKVCVKCPNITPTKDQKTQLKQIWQCASNRIMNSIGGTSFTECISLKNIPKLIIGWQKPIVIARHCFGDQYKAIELEPTGGKFELVFQGQSGKTTRLNVFDFKKMSGVAMAFYNTDEEITAFAHSCFKYALYQELPLYFTTKNTILKKYDGRFKDTFQLLYDKEYKKLFEHNNIWYQHRLIDDMVAYMMKSDGGYVWACKNYDGDVEVNCIAQAYGSNALAVSVQMGGDGIVLTEPVHGTVSRHYHRLQNGDDPSTNPTGIILAWARALAYRAKLDSNAQLIHFSKTLERSVSDAIEKSFMTHDLACCIYHTQHPHPSKYCNTNTFIEKVADILSLHLNNSKI